MRSAAHPQGACTYQMDAAMRRRTRQSASRRHFKQRSDKDRIAGLKALQRRHVWTFSSEGLRPLMALVHRT
jgi:hypothetical protein